MLPFSISRSVANINKKFLSEIFFFYCFIVPPFGRGIFYCYSTKSLVETGRSFSCIFSSWLIRITRQEAVMKLLYIVFSISFICFVSWKQSAIAQSYSKVYYYLKASIPHFYLTQLSAPSNRALALSKSYKNFWNGSDE